MNCSERTASAVLYAVPASVQLAWKSFGNEAEQAVFHSRSNHTHQLDDLAAWVLKRLEDTPQSRPALVESVMDEFRLELSEAEVDRYLANLLPRLVQLGLVEESTSCS